MPLKVLGLGFRFQGVGVWDLGFRTSDSGVLDLGLGFRIWTLGSRIHTSVCLFWNRYRVICYLPTDSIPIYTAVVVRVWTQGPVLV